MDDPKHELRMTADVKLEGDGMRAAMLIWGAKCVCDRLLDAIDDEHHDKPECERLIRELFDEIALLLNPPPPSSCPAGDDPNEPGGRSGRF